jgi:hypothetical protein
VSVFLGAAGHAEGLVHVVTRHDPTENGAFSVGFRLAKGSSTGDRRLMVLRSQRL